MSIRFGFFDSVNGDRIYDSNDFSNYFTGLIGNGIYKDFLDGLQVIADSETNLGIIVKSGKATIDGRWLLNDSDFSILLDFGGATRRFDCVVVQLNLNERTMSIKVIPWEQYTANDSSSVKNLALAKIQVEKDATVIKSSDITDMRPISGFVTGLIKQVDTSELFTQYEASIKEKEAEFDAYFNEKKTAFNDWFTKLTSDLIVNTTIKEFRNQHVITSNKVANLSLSINDYTVTDIIDVHLNGVWLIRDVDFTVTQFNENSISIKINRTLVMDDVIDVRILKSEIGDSVLTDSGDVLYFG